MYYEKTEQQVYMFDEQPQQQWHSFLEQKAIELKLTSAQTRVFITRFEYDNWRKKKEDICDEGDVNSFDAFVSRSTKVFEESEQNCREVSHKKSKQQMYVFDEQFKQQWHSFLEHKAIELDLTAAQTRVFITRFKYENWNIKIEDIWGQSEVSSIEAFKKHSTPIFNKLKPNCPGIGRGAGNDPIARKFLLEEFKSIYFSD